MTYLKPEVFANSFTCPHCATVAKQTWWMISWNGHQYQSQNDSALRVSTCQHCNQHTLWIKNIMFYPETGNAQYPNPEMPEAVKKIYLEAASIHSKSPRGASALLRLGIQLLCKELGESGNNINSDIAALVKKGLPEIVQKSLDIVRVTGNDAVHPGQIDTDNPETTIQLFNLTNIIVEYMIAMPKKVSGLYANLPVDKVTAIDTRDGK